MMAIKNLLIKSSSSLLEAIKVINMGGSQIALVVDDKNCLVGTITDGDIRRYILKNIDLQASVKLLMNTNFKYINFKDPDRLALQIMTENNLRQIPVLDNDRKVVNLLLINDFIENKDLDIPILIMAGGKGKRLRPHTSNCPKPMLEISGKPILQILIENYIAFGFKKFYISVNYLKEKIINYFEDGSKWNISIEYLIEDKPLGTAGSLKLISSKIDTPIFVINGDVLSKVDPKVLIQFHCENNSTATLCVRSYEMKLPFGVVETSGMELESFLEKPIYKKLINTGIYVIQPETLALIPEDKFFDMPDLFKLVKSNNKKVLVFPIHEYWIDIGRKESLEKASKTWDNFDE